MRSISLSFVVVSIIWLTTVKGQCPSGWTGFGSKCYYFGTNRLTWTDAEDFCQAQGGHLAKDTADVHSFLSAEAAQLDMTDCSPIWTCNLYIGLIYRPDEGYSWSDGTAVDESFMPWKPGEPNDGEVAKSGEIEYRSSDWSNFQWNDRSLTYSHPDSRYVCERQAVTCADGWVIFGTTCYYFGTNTLTWTEAEDYCQAEGGHLAKDTLDVHSFLSAEVAKIDTSGCSPIWRCNYFFALIYRPGEGYSWSDGSEVDESFMPWKPGEPNDGEVTKSGEIELRSSDWSYFNWNDRSLDYHVPDSRYICERAACQEGWKPYGSKCYYFGMNELTWSEAEEYCQQEGGHLAKDTADVHSFLSAEAAKLDTSVCSPIWKCNLFIGLLYEPGNGYKWSDGSAVDESFMPWKPGEPNDGEVTKSGEIEYRSSDWSNFQWNDRSLTYNYPTSRYVCEKNA